MLFVVRIFFFKHLFNPIVGSGVLSDSITDALLSALKQLVDIVIYYLKPPSKIQLSETVLGPLMPGQLLKIISLIQLKLS